LIDGCVDFAGYDVKVCPISGIVGMSRYLVICGEAVGKGG
jgi:hypothetical protein